MLNLRRLFASLGFGSFAITSGAMAASLHVPADYPTIQAALDAARVADTVLVAAGTYRGDGNRDLDFRGKDLVLRSEKGRDATWIDCEGTDKDPHRGVYLHSGETLAATVEGFTITGGRFPVGDLPTSRGGGVNLDDASATLVDCTIRDCSAWLGGGVCALGPVHGEPIALTMIGCDVIDCGDGLFTSGGGIYTGFMTFKASDCRIEGNHAFQNAGGLFLNTFSNLSATRCTFSGNTLTGLGPTQGAGLRTYRSSMDLQACSFQNNGFLGEKGSGGGIYHHWFEGDEPYHASLTNCLVTGNAADEGGGICVDKHTSLDLRFSTVSGNSARLGAGVGVRDTAEVKATSLVIWGNEGGREVHTEPAGTFRAAYCNIAAGWEGEGNIDEDPLFIDSANGDYHLTDGSPCIDAADALGGTSTDLDGDRRPQGDGYDMGSDEFRVEVNCDLDVQLSGYPSSLMPGEKLEFLASAHNDCEEGLGLDEATMTISGPAGLVQTLYSGRMIVLEAGTDVGAKVKLNVPSAAPLGTYEIEVSISREGEAVDSESFSLEITDS